MIDPLFVWWRRTNQIRTKRRLDFLEGNRLCAAFEVVSDNQLIIVKEVDGVYKGVDDAPLVFIAVYIAVLELIYPTYDQFLRIARLL